VDFREGWAELGASLEGAVSEADYASLARCTQYAHFTPEFIIRAIWARLQRLGWRGGRVLEPGIGTGLFPALMPMALREDSFFTGIELDPVTARIVRLLQPKARIINSDFARTELSAVYDLAIGNPPFSNRIVRSDRDYRSLGLRLHDYFIARSIDLLKPGALAAFITSSRKHSRIGSGRTPIGPIAWRGSTTIVSTTSRRENSTAHTSNFPAPLAPSFFMGIRSAASGGSSRRARPTSPMPSAPARP
jgi:hypothetical protein